MNEDLTRKRERLVTDDKKSVAKAYLNVIELFNREEPYTQQEFAAAVHRISFEHRFSKHREQESLKNFLDFADRLYSAHAYVLYAKEKYQSLSDETVCKDLFGYTPHGQVTFSFSSFAIDILFQDQRDVTSLFHIRKEKKTNHRAVLTQRETNHNVAGFFENVKIDAFSVPVNVLFSADLQDQSDLVKGTKAHERQHYFFLQSSIPEESSTWSTETFLTLNGVDRSRYLLHSIVESYYHKAIHDLKDEILAMIAGNAVPSDDPSTYAYEALIDELSKLQEVDSPYNYMATERLKVPSIIRSKKIRALLSGNFAQWYALQAVDTDMVDQMHRDFETKYIKLRDTVISSIPTILRHAKLSSIREVTTLLMFVDMSNLAHLVVETTD